MYGKYCAHYRGYGNGNTELGAMVEILGGNAYPFRVSEEYITEKKVQEWWVEEVNSGPKRKKRILENQEISVQYTSLDIVLPD